MNPETPAYETFPITVEGNPLQISALIRRGRQPAILWLHGFGSCKEELHDLIFQRPLKEHTFLAYDAPGCAATHTADPSAATIAFMVATAEAVLHHYGVDRFHLIGHSMGGLVALMLADRHPDRILSFVDIKGNLTLEDCFLSRQIFTHPGSTPEEFLEMFIERTRSNPAYSTALYASTLPARVRPAAIEPIFRSMVELSDGGDLMDRFLALQCPRMFMYGELNRDLSYLGTLREHGVALAEIPQSGHFPMYSNPVDMFGRIVGFMKSSAVI
ncbi:alpha/beta fold hydrolase [Aspergillus fijiensis CBS 313.89]|uniref:Putative hydrolase or acyltransferase of alpha/beta superfamily n=1 Tax=Aspergillus fijiensis CBS 313.89 TaxID=1448319 RepID=A0A8G1RZF8_9EURO|nr:putative hydrolase or acyltransferase of alpha/beta superfamily [Aspergillus fijiensis CBS 313.89]RAK81582.1 putative hydrolase or acyltransferase of alpha/beta superfamily [Aspergillus fijiensis CBS 313.89]